VLLTKPHQIKLVFLIKEYRTKFVFLGKGTLDQTKNLDSNLRTLIEEKFA